MSEGREYYYYDVSEYRVRMGVLIDNWFVEDFKEVKGFEGFVGEGTEIIKSSIELKGLEDLRELVDFKG